MSAMTAGGEWSACVAVARHALQAYRNKEGIKLTLALAGCAVVFTVLAFVAGGRTYKPVMLAASAFVGLLLLVLWVAVFTSLMAQNAMPAALVPGIRRRSIKVLALAWLAATVGLTVPLAESGLPVAATAIGVACVWIFASLSMIRPVPVALMMGALILLNYINVNLIPISPAYVLIACILLSVWAAAIVVRTMLGGKSSVIHDFSLAYFTTINETRAPGTAYAKILMRDSASGNTSALLLHCLGPLLAKPLTWPAMVAVLFMALTFALTMAVPSLGTAYGTKTSLHVVIPASFIISMLMQAYIMGSSLRRTVGEQALVMLSGRRPDAATINCLLGRALMVRFGYHWLMGAVVVLVLSAIFGARTEQLTWMLAMFVTALAAGTLLLQNYAKAKNDGLIPLVMLALGAAVTLVVSILAKTSMVLGGLFVALWTLVALVSFALRWRAIMRAPVAFPARRIA